MAKAPSLPSPLTLTITPEVNSEIRGKIARSHRPSCIQIQSPADLPVHSMGDDWPQGDVEAILFATAWVFSGSSYAGHACGSPGRVQPSNGRELRIAGLDVRRLRGDICMHVAMQVLVFSFPTMRS